MKKGLTILLAIFMCFAMIACSSTPPTKDNKGEDTGAEGDNIGEISPEQDAEEEQEMDKDEDIIPVLALGETKTIENTCEFTLDYVNITSRVEPLQKKNVYSYYEAENGKVYVDICFAYKNLENSDVPADEVITGTLTYAGKYEYTGFSMIEEDNRSDFTYSNITSIAPLTTEYMHYLFEVPEDVGNSGAAVEAKITVGTETYKIIVKDGSADVKVEIGATQDKESGVVVQGETVTTANAEFFVDYAKIASRIQPPQPGSVYSYYEAEREKVYVDICFAYKNLAGSDAPADEVISAKLKYAGKYEYTGFSMIEEDNRSDFTYSNITSIAPLSTEYVHYLFEVPQEVENSNESIEITFFVEGNEYIYKVR